MRFVRHCTPAEHALELILRQDENLSGGILNDVNPLSGISDASLVEAPTQSDHLSIACELPVQSSRIRRNPDWEDGRECPPRDVDVLLVSWVLPLVAIIVSAYQLIRHHSLQHVAEIVMAVFLLLRAYSLIVKAG